MSRFLASARSKIKPYVPGEQPRGQVFIKLNTNEAPYPPPPSVLEAVAASGSRLNLYSDPTGAELRAELATYHGVAADNVSLGNGSDDSLAFIFMAFCDENAGIVFPDVTYGLYPVLANLLNIPYTEIPLTASLELNVVDYLNAGRTVIFANPNAPTGIAMPLSDIERIAQANRDNVVVIDEAYADFWGESAIGLTARHENLLVVRTYSKSRFLAGARIAYMVGSRELIADVEAIRNSLNPYNNGIPALAAGTAALRESDYYTARWAELIDTRTWALDALRKRGFETTDSRANFIFVRHDAIPSAELMMALREHGILVRNLGPERIRDWLRITIGMPEQMDALTAAVDAIFREKGISK